MFPNRFLLFGREEVIQLVNSALAADVLPAMVISFDSSLSIANSAAPFLAGLTVFSVCDLESTEVVVAQSLQAEFAQDSGTDPVPGQTDTFVRSFSEGDFPSFLFLINQDPEALPRLRVHVTEDILADVLIVLLVQLAENFVEGGFDGDLRGGTHIIFLRGFRVAALFLRLFDDGGQAFDTG